MTSHKLLVVGILALGAAACARSAQQAPPPSSPSVRVSTPAPAAPVAAAPAPSTAINPVGVYDFSTSAEGQDVSGTITIVARDGGGYGGSIVTSATAEGQLRSVSVRDSTITMAWGSEMGDAVLEIIVSGDSFTGSWAMGGMSGVLKGRKRAG